MSKQIIVQHWMNPRDKRTFDGELSEEMLDLVDKNDVMIREISGQIHVFIDTKGKRLTQR